MKLDEYARFDKLVTSTNKLNTSVTETIRKISVEISQLRKERDAWRGVACKFANTIESIIGETPYDVMLKKDLVEFKEILNKYKEV